MRKAEKIDLAKELYGKSLPQCKEHHLPLVYHVADFYGDGSSLEGCWDCPAEGCQHHVHESPGKPWTPLGTGEIDHMISKTVAEFFRTAKRRGLK